MRKTAFFLVVFVLILSLTLVSCKGIKVFELRDEPLTIAIGDRAKLPLTIKGYKDAPIILSSDPSILSIDGDYAVGVSVGTAIVTVTLGDVTKSITVEVITSYNEEYVNVSFVIEQPTGYDKIERFSTTISKKYYSTVVENTTQASLGDVPSPKFPDGYAFSGWCINQECTAKATFPYNLTTADVIFYGKWIIRDGTTANDPNIQLKYTFDEVEKTAKVTGFAYPEVPYETIVIPSTYQNQSTNTTYTVTAIADDAFKDNATLKSVTMPSIASIGNSAFENCPLLTKVSVDHNTLKSVGNRAFFGSGLIELVSEDKVVSVNEWQIETIGLDAFSGTTYMDNFTRVVRNAPIDGDYKATYLGFLHSGTYIAYDYDWMSDASKYADGYAKAITLTSLVVTKVSCTFAEQDIRLILVGYSTEDADRLKALFVAQGIAESNVVVK